MTTLATLQAIVTALTDVIAKTATATTSLMAFATFLATY